MPESMFGPPYLLPSHPPTQTTPASRTPPVPPKFQDVRFDVIGKPPGLLSRISAPQPDHPSYHSPTPSPSSTLPSVFANNGVSQPQSSSRPTLLQQLAGRDSSRMDVPIQSNGSLASRIQMDVTPATDPASAASGTTIGPSSRLQGSNGNNALIPPVEVLPQVSDSSAPPTPTSSAPAAKRAAVHDTMSTAPLVTSMPTRTVQLPAPSVLPPNTAGGDGTVSFPSFAAVDAIMRDLQPPPSAAVPIDSLAARQERLQAISANLANLTLSLPPASSHSSSPDPSSVTRLNENTTPEQPNDPQHPSNHILLRHPYLASQSSGLELSADDPLDASDSSLTFVPSPAILTQKYEVHHRAFMEAFEVLSSTLDAVHRAQIDSEHALAQRIRTFEERRAALEQRRRAEVARLQRESQELQEKREELNAKEVSLASLEKESKAREDARKIILARRQTREEEKRAADAKRNQEVQEQIAVAIKELKEFESLKADWQDQLRQSVETSDDLPTEPQDDMDEAEKRIITSRNELLGVINQIRRGLTGPTQQLEAYNRTLRGLEVKRKWKEAEKAESQRIAEEQRLPAHAAAERVRQVQDNRRQLEAEGRRPEVENDREQARLLHEQQAHAEAQARLRRPAVTSHVSIEHRSHLEDNSIPQPQATTDTTRIRAARDVSSLSQKVAEAMQVDEDGTTSAPHRPISVPDAQRVSGPSQPSSSSTTKQVTSGGVMPATSTLKAGATHLPPKPSGKTPSFTSPDQIEENSPNFANPSLTVSAPTKGGHGSSFPAQLASEFNRALSTDVHHSPDRRTPFPRTPKPNKVLDGNQRGNQELNIGPAAGVSPTQQNVNLRHLKRSRGRVDENDSGDRNVQMADRKNEEIVHPRVKNEEHDVTSESALTLTNPPASLPPRPTVIPPPRLRKPNKHDNASESLPYLPSNEQPLKREEASIAIDKQTLCQRSSGSQTMNTLAQLPVPAEIQSSLLLDPVHLEGHFTEPRPNVGESLTQDRSQSHVTPSPISATATATSSHRPDREDSSRKNRHGDDHRMAPGRGSSQRLPDHHSPPPHTSRPAIASPPRPHRPIESVRQPDASGGHRVEPEPIRAPTPVTGKKRPSQNDDNEHGHRARRPRGDHWVAPDYDGRGDSYRPYWDRRNDSDEERRATHRVLSPPPVNDHTQPYPSDLPRAIHDNRTYASPSPESSRWEPPSRRSDNDGNYQRHLSAYRTATDQHRMDDIRVGQPYEPVPDGRMDPSDPSLLARMSSSQHYPPSTNHRGRGRGDLGRGRGRSTGRGGPPLLDRITSGRLQLEDRLT